MLRAMDEWLNCGVMMEVAIYVGAFFVAFTGSTVVIKVFVVPRIPQPEDGHVTEADRWAGFWIGFCETIIIFLLASAGEYGALAIILGAKEFVRKQKIEAKASYYLLGTLVNMAIALLMVRIADLAVSQW